MGSRVATRLRMSMTFARDRLSGLVLESLFTAGTLARWARMARLHGRTFAARVVRHPDLAPNEEPLAERFVGDANVRFSGGVWPRHAPMLGCAVRFRHEEILFAAKANVADYFDNDYYSVSQLDVGLHLRLRRGGGEALELEVGASASGPWSPIARVELDTRGLAHAVSEWVRPRSVP
jgi:hypothetical protein